MVWSMFMYQLFLSQGPSTESRAPNKHFKRVPNDVILHNYCQPNLTNLTLTNWLIWQYLVNKIYPNSLLYAKQQNNSTCERLFWGFLNLLVFLLNFAANFLLFGFFSFSAQKMLKMKISTIVGSVQHPNAD